jgi:hypothetical protein
VIEGANTFSRDATARQLAASNVMALMRTSVEKVDAQSVALKVICPLFLRLFASHILALVCMRMSARVFLV